MFRCISVEMEDRFGEGQVSWILSDVRLKYKQKLNFREFYFDYKYLSFILLG